MKTKTYATLAVVVGLMFGIGVGIFQSIAKPASAVNHERQTMIGVGNGMEKAATQAQITVGSETARAFAKKAYGKDVAPRFLGVRWNPYIAKTLPDGKEEHQKQYVEYVDNLGLMYSVDKESGQVYQVGPAPRMKESDPDASTLHDYTKKYSKEQLETLARELIAKQGVDLDAVTKGLKLQVLTKDGESYFFRWENNSKEGEMRFLQVGLTPGGSLLSYVNTLSI